MVTREEFMEALRAMNEFTVPQMTEVFRRLCTNRVIYRKISELFDHYDELTGNEREMMLAMRRGNETPETAEKLGDEELSIRFTVLQSMAFGIGLGYRIHEIQANYKPPRLDTSRTRGKYRPRGH